MPLLPGWRKEGSKYVSGNAEPVSKRQYDNARARAIGFENYSQFQRIGKRQHYKDWLASYSQEKGTSERKARALDSEYHRLYTETFITTRKNGRRTEKDAAKMSSAPNSPFAKFLEEIGARERGATYNVGETPR
jgi:hypothetical protein